MVRAQNDVYMVVNNNGAEVNSNSDNTESSVEEGKLTIGELQRATKNICNFILNAPVIERKLVDTDVAKYYPAVHETEAIVNISFAKSNLAQSTVNVNANGETMAVIQTNGTDGNWITQKLCKVKLDKGAYNLKLEDVLAGIQVKYIQFKKLKKK